MDTLFWGPPGWQLFHLISFGPHPEPVLSMLKDIVPCKFCRASTAEFMANHPLKGDPAHWLYELHNKVNNKLRTQCHDDPKVPDPGPDPSFEEIKHRYETMRAHRPHVVPGRDFLFAISRNYPDDLTDEWKHTQIKFFAALAKVYPYEPFEDYLIAHPLQLGSREAYMRWVYGLLKMLSRKFRASLPSFKGYAHHVAYYKSGCSKRTYHGRTCRNGTKARDMKKTRRIAHQRLITF